MTVNVMDRIMSTSIIILDQNFNANYVDIMVFKPSVLLPPPRRSWGGGLKTWSIFSVNYPQPLPIQLPPVKR